MGKFVCESIGRGLFIKLRAVEVFLDVKFGYAMDSQLYRCVYVCVCIIDVVVDKVSVV